MISSPAWTDAPMSPSLTEDDIHLWLLRLDPPAGKLAEFASVLDGREQERAERFHFDRDRSRFVAAHGALRLILGGYLACEPRAVVFGHSPRGKPFVPGTTIRFNLSHSGSIGLVALAADAEIGCDVEQITERVPIDDLAARFFSDAERRALAVLPLGERRAAFFACWTQKEAFVKARSEGLTLPLDAFDVCVHETGGLRATRPDSGEASRWWMTSIAPPPGYAGAICVEAKARGPVRHWRFADTPTVG